MGKPVFHDIAGGWIKIKPNGETIVSFSANGEKAKNKLIVQLENGTQYECSRFFMQDNKFKKNETHPDKRLVFVVEED